MSEQKRSEVFVGLGTNLGNKAANLKAAIDALKSDPAIDYLEQSSIYKNDAIEDAGPDEFFNQVVLFETLLSPHEFLAKLQKVEKELDPQREKRGRKKARYIDLDILTFSDQKINQEDLVIPHPRMKDRDFVMNPLKELQTKVYKNKILNANNTDPAIDNLANFGNFVRALSGKEKQIIAKIDKYIANFKGFYLRPMMLEDLDTILKIDEEAFGKKHWSRETFVKELNNQYATYYVVTDEAKEVLGFIGIWLIFDEMHIMTLAIDEKAKRKRLAETLLLLAFKHSWIHRARTSTLEVKANNSAAISLYDKYLFKQQGMRPKYYADGQSALLLWTKDISSDEFLDNFELRLNYLMQLQVSPAT